MEAIAQKKRSSTRYSRIWAAARQLGMSSDSVHDLVFRETKKQSMTELSDTQIAAIGNLLWNMANGRPTYGKPRLTNEGGRPETQRQRARLYKEAMKIGWTPERVDGLVLHRFGVAKQQWLNRYQCSVMIEIFKDKVRRAKRPDISRLQAALHHRMEQLEGREELAG